MIASSPNTDRPSTDRRDPPGVTADRIVATEALIRARIRCTPVIRVDGAELGLAAGPLLLKLEHLQHSGSFKARGAFANLLLRPVPASGVVAASGGNHGAAVACAARALGVPATIFVPTVSSPAKIGRIRDYGAELVVTGDTYSDALAASRDWAATRDALEVHAFDQVETMLGTGTLAVELQRQAPDADTVVCAVGGGGLLAGLAAGSVPGTRVIGVEPVTSPTLTRALAAGRPVDAPTGGVAVDALAPRRVGEQTFAVITAHAPEVLLVDDADILRAQSLLWERLRIVAEPAGAAGLAALVSGQITPTTDGVVAIVVSGANTTAVALGTPNG